MKSNFSLLIFIFVFVVLLFDFISQATSTTSITHDLPFEGKNSIKETTFEVDERENKHNKDKHGASVAVHLSTKLGSRAKGFGGGASTMRGNPTKSNNKNQASTLMHPSSFLTTLSIFAYFAFHFLLFHF